MDHAAWSISDLIIKKLKFFARRSRKTRDFEKNSIRNMAKIAFILKLLGFLVPKS